jgi:hypothetical protein
MARWDRKYVPNERGWYQLGYWIGGRDYYRLQRGEKPLSTAYDLAENAKNRQAYWAGYNDRRKRNPSGVTKYSGTELWPTDRLIRITREMIDDGLRKLLYLPKKPDPSTIYLMIEIVGPGAGGRRSTVRLGGDKKYAEGYDRIFSSGGSAPQTPATRRTPLPMVREPISLGPVRTVPGVRVNQGHVFHGEINKKGNAVGYHHRPGGQDAPTARVTQIVDPPSAQGVYTGRVEVFNPATNTWVKKGPLSSFYPDAWTQDRVLFEIRGAYGTRNATKGNYWEGTSPSGVRIGGYLNPDGSINTAFPIR